MHPSPLLPFAAACLNAHATVAERAAAWRRIERGRESAAYNATAKGLARACGEVVWFLDADGMLADDSRHWSAGLLTRLVHERTEVLIGEIQIFHERSTP